MEGFIIEEELKKLPTSSGVYIMHKKDGEVIYVGKAKVLKNRVRQYFNPSYKKTEKITQMVKNIDYFEYIVVDNELESLILESNFIKEYRPKYNTLLKDDKNYPYIKITNETYPRVLFSYRKYDDGCKYFGPYKSKLSINQFLEFIKRNYKIRTCNKNEKVFLNKNSITKLEDTKLRKECLYYHIDMCLAPCIRCDIKNEYDENIKEIAKILSGNIKPVVDELKKRMLDLSEQEKFEECMDIRDKIYSIEELSTKQKIDSKTDTNVDILGLYREDNNALIQIFEVREGKIIDRNVNILHIDREDEDKDIILSFIKQYYNETYFLPKEIVLPVSLGEEKKLIEEWLNRDNRKKILLTEDDEKNKNGLLKLANMNAKIQFEQRIKKYKKDEKDIEIAKDDLRKIVGIDVCERFESYDISNIKGSYNVASMVVYDGYNFKKNDYRKFKIKSFEGQDDYRSMEEIIDRRINHALDEDSEKYWKLPDIFLIDGGLGQVHVVEDVLKKYSVNVPVIGMVKDDFHRTRGIVYNDMEIDLHNFKELFKFITKIQDETHRFAIEYHKSLRSKGQTKSILDDIIGIGEKRKVILIKSYGSIDKIKEATVEELASLPTFNKTIAKNIKDYVERL